MIARLFPACVGVVACCAAVAAIAGQQPAFRSGVAAVSVDVSVRVRNAPVEGLAPQDFELLDNGVVQRVETIAIEAVPLDVSILVDVSGGAGIPGWSQRVQQLQQNASDIASLLKPADRFRMIAIGSDIREVLPFQPAREPVQLKSQPEGGARSFFDALLLALIHEPDFERRHLIVAFTDPHDYMSVATAAQVADAGRHSEASVHVIPMRHLILPRTRMSGRPVGTWFPWRFSDDSALERIVESTGGQVYTAEAFSVPEGFRKVVDDYRSRYLLRYVPENVQQKGWHQLTVRVRQMPKAIVRARNGYFGR